MVRQGTKNKPLPQCLQQRNEAVAFIQQQGSKAWKIKEAYHQRSLSEVARFRYKNTCSAQMKAGKMENQETEVKLKCKILNTCRCQGMPLAYKAAA